MSDCVWRLPSQPLTLPDDRVHVWRAFLDAPAWYKQDLYQTLAEDERARAARFHFDKDRNHYIVARGVLRAILGGYLAVQSRQLHFEYTTHGKPSLPSEFGGGRLRFNLSHSHGLALYAMTWGRELGIDVEYLRADFAGEDIAERFFSRQEVAALRTLDPALHVEAFFNCWTRKEAYIKAIGEGLSMPLDRFDVSLIPGEPARLLHTQGDPLEASRWTMQALFPGDGYAAAVIVAGHAWQLECWQWPAP